MPLTQGFRAIIMGPPGCGKGFISKKIISKYGAVHISAGDMLRDHIRYRTSLGKEAISYTSKGQLVPNYLLTRIMQHAIKRAGNCNLVLDGYPRTIKQAEILKNMMDLDFVLNLDMPWRALLAKIKNRMVHPASGRVYNVGALAPIVPGRDDITGERLVRRVDDEPLVVWTRLLDYAKQMEPVIRHYEDQNIMHTILVRHHEIIWPQVKRYLKKRLNRLEFSVYRRQGHVDLVSNN